METHITDAVDMAVLHFHHFTVVELCDTLGNLVVFFANVFRLELQTAAATIDWFAHYWEVSRKKLPYLVEISSVQATEWFLNTEDMQVICAKGVRKCVSKEIEAMVRANVECAKGWKVRSFITLWNDLYIITYVHYYLHIF